MEGCGEGHLWKYGFQLFCVEVCLQMTRLIKTVDPIVRSKTQTILPETMKAQRLTLAWIHPISVDKIRAILPTLNFGVVSK